MEWIKGSTGGDKTGSQSESDKREPRPIPMDTQATGAASHCVSFVLHPCVNQPVLCVCHSVLKVIVRSPFRAKHHVVVPYIWQLD